MSGARESTGAERVARLLAARPEVAARVADVRAHRATILDGARGIGRRLRPSGALGAELRARPLRAIGLLGVGLLLAVRWFGGGSRRDRSTAGPAAEHRDGAAGAFLRAVAAAAAARGGRAIVDALFDAPSTAADDDGGRVAKR